MMQVMSVPPRVIPISAEAPAPAVGCSACVAAAAAEVRGIDANGTAPAPMLSGSPAHVQHLLHCVESALAEAGAASPNLVSALRVNDDEAELDLAVAPRCGGAILTAGHRHLCPHAAAQRDDGLQRGLQRPRPAGDRLPTDFGLMASV